MSQPGPVTIDPTTNPPTISPDPVLAKGANCNTVFKIASNATDWKWDQPAIVVTAGPGLFSDGNSPGGNGKGNVNVKSRNNAGEQGLFKYTANLVQISTGTKLAIDPQIDNEL